METRIALGAVLIATALAGAASAQTGPPIQGTLATEATMNSFYAAAHTIIVTTIDGVERVYQVAKNAVVHDDKNREPGVLERVSPGTTVVVHYAHQAGADVATEIDLVGAEGLQITEGTVSKINRGKRQLTVRFTDGSTQVFQLTERAIEEQLGVPLDAEPGAHIVIYFVEQNGHRTAHYFRRVS